MSRHYSLKAELRRGLPAKAGTTNDSTIGLRARRLSGTLPVAAGDVARAFRVAMPDDVVRSVAGRGAGEFDEVVRRHPAAFAKALTERVLRERCLTVGLLPGAMFFPELAVPCFKILPADGELPPVAV